MAKKPITALIIMDGFGINPIKEGNAILAAGTPNVSALEREYAYTTLQASGMSVGLPEGQMGNSEVGHLNIGAGRIVYQELTRITKEILEGSLFTNPALLEACTFAKNHGSKLHIMGLLSDGGVHSHIDHLFALLELAKRQGIKDVCIHCFLDGRDVPPQSGKGFIEQLQAELLRQGIGKIVTVMGRYWAMDRDKRWERVERAYNAMKLGEGNFFTDPAAAVQASYDRSETDEFVQPAVIVENGQPVAKIEKEDAVIFFNFRPDRTREITRPFIEEKFDGFYRKGGYQPVKFISMTQYDVTFENITVAYAPQTLNNTLGEYLSQNGLTQLRIAETEKYAHVTFFFNGGVEASNPGEDRALIPSPKVATYDMKPEMSAYEVADEAVKRIESGRYDVMILNFANCDMVGHTGVFDAAVKAVSAVDVCVDKVVKAILAQGGRALITADHGNADKMIDYETGEPFTAHTTNPVPFILVDPTQKHAALREGGKLADIAPTLLTMLGLPIPTEMTGTSLLQK